MTTYVLNLQDVYQEMLSAVSSVLYSPDQRTKMTIDTREVLFVVYAPAGVEKEGLQSHLEDIKQNVVLFSTSVEIETAKIFTALDETDVL